jgi:hypothetical protein
VVASSGAVALRRLIPSGCVPQLSVSMERSEGWVAASVGLAIGETNRHRNEGAALNRACCALRREGLHHRRADRSMPSAPESLVKLSWVGVNLFNFAKKRSS